MALKALMPVADIDNLDTNEQAIKTQLEAAAFVVTLWPLNDTTWLAANYDIWIDSPGGDTWQSTCYSKVLGAICFNYSNRAATLLGNGAAGYSLTYFNLAENAHPITDSFTEGIFFCYATNHNIRHLTGFANDVVVLANRWSDTAKASVAYLEEFTHGFNGAVTPARRVWLATEQAHDWTDNAKKLFRQAATWAAGHTTNPYPTTLLQKHFNCGYHCFISNYLAAIKAGYDPLRLPDGTPF